MTLNQWFLKNTKIPLRVLVAFMALIYFLFIYYAVETHRASQDKNLKDLIVGTVLIGVQQNDRVLIESALERSIENLGAKAAFLCKNNELIFNTSSSVKSCDSIPNDTLMKRRVSFTELGFGEYELHFIAPNFVVASSHLWLLIVSLLVLLASFWIIRRLGKHLMSDIFSPMEDVLLSEKSSTEIKEFKKIKEKINLLNASKQKVAFEKAFDESKNKFSHNIKSPLRNIKVLHERFKQDLDEDENRLFERVIDEVSSLTENLEIENPYSETQKIKSKKAIYNVSQILEKSVKLKQMEWSSEKHTPKIKIDSAHNSAPVFLDLSEFRSILSNLMNNAKDAGAKNITLNLKREKDQVELFISDDGSGISKKLSKNIFDKGFTHGKDTGTGYGLYHAKKYLNQWTGDINLLEAKVGAAFRIALPVWDYKKISISKADKVVILEDNPFFQKQTEALLLQAGVYSENIKAFCRSSDFQNWVDSQSEQTDFVLFADNDLGENEPTGLEVMRGLKQRNVDLRAYLVTDGHESAELVNKAISSELELIPKFELNKAFIELTNALISQDSYKAMDN